MGKLFLIFGIIPIFIRLLLYVFPLLEKGKYGIVTLPKSIFLIFPSVVLPFILICLSLNIYSYIKSDFIDEDFLFGIVILSICLVGSVFLLITYKHNIIRYDNNRIIYKKKCYLFSEIRSLGWDEKKYYFVINNQEKVKIDILSPGVDMMIKEYYKFIAEYKKETKSNNSKKKK